MDAPEPVPAPAPAPESAVEPAAPVVPASAVPPAPPRRSPVIAISGLRKSYGRVEAVRGLDLTACEGEVYGFLGRNGAGKSTTIRILMGISRPTAGEVRLFGLPLRGDGVELRQRVGYVAQEQNFYGWMTAVTIGRFVRGFYPTWDDAEYARLIGAMDLPPQRKIRAYSGGMKAKLALALALAHRPRLLILDEPTAGLDAVARREFLEMVRSQALRDGATTFFSSHLIDEVERAADRVGIVDDGRMRYEGRLSDLSARVRLLRLPAPAAPSPLPPALAAGGPFTILQDRLRTDAREVVIWSEDPARFDDLRAGLPQGALDPMGLEDIFIDMVSKPLSFSPR